jgi:hypothetical protein
MLTILIFLALRKIRNRIVAIRVRRQTFTTAVLCIFLALSTNNQLLNAQAQPTEQYTRYYDVRYNGKVSGKIAVNKKVDGGVTRMRIESNFKLQLLIPVTVKSVEEAEFFNEIMTFSSVDRRVNGREKLNQKLVATGESYHWSGAETRKSPSFPIRYSVVSLYYQEPKGQQAVFSDTYGRKMPIYQVKKGIYRLDLPNGNFNYYNYVDGVCTLIEIHHSFFQIQFVLRT